MNPSLGGDRFNILVLYHSESGNTRQMAETVAGGATQVPGCTIQIKSVEVATAEDLRWCDGIALGSPTHYGSVSWEMKRWWDELPDGLWGTIDGKIGCAFSSSGAWGGGAELVCLNLLVILINYGFLVFGVTSYVAKKFTLHYGSVIAGAPREQRETDSCLILGKRLAEMVVGRPSDQSQTTLEEI